MAAPDERWTFDLCGGHLALDFANTVSSRHTDSPIERLVSYGELVSFARQSGLVNGAAAKRLSAWGQAHPREAAALLRRAVTLLDALFRSFAAMARQEPPSRGDLDAVNDAIGRTRLGETLGWEWADGPDAPDAFLCPVIRAAVELVTSRARDRIRLCEAPDCVWLFQDTSKNRSRRWCDMKQCGNRMKARRFYERHHGHV